MRPTNGNSTRPARLYIFQYGIHPLTRVPVPGYLIEMQDGRKVLVDTGFGLPENGATRTIHWFRVSPTDHVLARLASVSVDPGQISAVICTHLDPDHCGAHDRFAHAPFYIQRSHYVAAHLSQYPRFEIQRQHWAKSGLHYELVRGDQELFPGVVSLETSGHVPGHQSVLVYLHSGRTVLLAIDAIARGVQDANEYVPHPFDMDPEGVRRSIGKLRSIIHSERVSDVVFGHDAHQWARLCGSLGQTVLS